MVFSPTVVDYSMTETSSSEDSETEEQKVQVDNISRVPSPQNGDARRPNKKLVATSPPNIDYKTSSPYVEDVGNSNAVVPSTRKNSTRGTYPAHLVRGIHI